MRVILKDSEMRARFARWRESAAAADKARTAKQKRDAAKFRLYEAPTSFGYSKANGVMRLLGFSAAFGHVMPKEWLEVRESTLVAAHNRGLIRIAPDSDFPSGGTIYISGTANDGGVMRALIDLCELVEGDAETV